VAKPCTKFEECGFSHSEDISWGEILQELIMEMRYPNVTWHIMLPVYLFTTELRHSRDAPIV